MKKVLCLLVCVVIGVVGCLSVASAATVSDQTYSSILLASLDWTSAEMVKSSDMRILSLATLLIDYFVNAKETDSLGEFNWITGTAYIADYGTCVDAYYELNNGDYRDLFYMPVSKEIYEFDMPVKPSGTEHTYYSVKMYDVFEKLGDVLEILNK